MLPGDLGIFRRWTFTKRNCFWVGYKPCTEIPLKLLKNKEMHYPENSKAFRIKSYLLYFHSVRASLPYNAKCNLLFILTCSYIIPLRLKKQYLCFFHEINLKPRWGGWEARSVDNKQGLLRLRTDIQAHLLPRKV